jgi:5'-3' exonuclease
MQNIILVDCFNVGHIAFHSMGELDYHGRRTGVMYGFMLKVLQLAKTFNTNHFVFCWDSQRSVRRMMYETYKDRPKNTVKKLSTGEVIDYMALHDQLTELRKYQLYQLGFANSIMYAGLEADDVVALVIKNGEVPAAWGEPHWVIASTDRDLYQLLGPNVTMYNIKSKKTFSEKQFKDLYGIEPQQWAHAKALGGCDGDTVAGIKGIADPAKSIKSRALKYLRGELTGSYAELIESELGQYIYKRNLALVSLPVTNNLRPQLHADQFSRDRFIQVFDELGFASFLKPEKFKDWEVYFGLT